MGRMGLEPILPVKVPVTIGTMLNLYRAEFKINLVSVRENKASKLHRNQCNGSFDGQNSSALILFVKRSVSVGTMINSDEDGDGHENGTCKRTFKWIMLCESILDVNYVCTVITKLGLFFRVLFVVNRQLLLITLFVQR